MILIAEAGSTKCDWVLLNDKKEIILHTQTSGLNPAVLHENELKTRISGNKELNNHFSEKLTLDFYGAGCGTSEPKERLNRILNELFPQSKVQIFEDTWAAVRAVTNTPGIVCILGTGSNSAYFNGKTIDQPVPSLGYTIMDEAGGFYFGRALLRDYFYKKMPKKVAEKFEKEFDLNPNEIKINLYQKPHPNAYVASFASFIFKEKTEPEAISYFYRLIKEGIATFIDCRILSFEKAHEIPVHFVGSVAYFSKEIITELFKENNLILGKIVQRPMDGLLTYYASKN